MKLIPLSNNIIVKEIEGKEERKTTSGFLLPQDNNNIDITSGEVLCVGPGLIEAGEMLDKITVKKGDIVYFHKATKNDIIFEQETYSVISNNSLLCFFRK